MIQIFFISFIVALTGALSPGPLLTFTIYKSIRQKRGYLAGIFIVLGHATIEFFLIMALLAGATLFFQNILFLSIIGVIGSFFLVIFGFLVIKNVFNTDFNLDFNLEDNSFKGYKGNSFLGGIIVSLSNPYWEFWWAVIGLSLMISFNISFKNPIGILLFFIGHELGDIIWYLPISMFVYFGGKRINPKIYKYMLIACGVFMIIFGIYLMISIIIVPPVV
ncbi:MAG: LysE family transporter [Promethearchaeota archaeon]